jgi:hypothetical protein
MKEFNRKNVTKEEFKQFIKELNTKVLIEPGNINQITITLRYGINTIYTNYFEESFNNIKLNLSYKNLLSIIVDTDKYGPESERYIKFTRNLWILRENEEYNISTNKINNHFDIEIQMINKGNRKIVAKFLSIKLQYIIYKTL